MVAAGSGADVLPQGAGTVSHISEIPLNFLQQLGSILSSFADSFALAAAKGSIPANARYDYKDLVNFFCDGQCVWDKSRGDAYYVGDLEDDIDVNYIKNWARRSDAEFMFEMGKHVDTRIGWNVYVNNGGIEVFQIFQPVLQNTSTPKNVLDATDGEIQTAINKVFN